MDEMTDRWVLFPQGRAPDWEAAHETVRAVFESDPVFADLVMWDLDEAEAPTATPAQALATLEDDVRSLEVAVAAGRRRFWRGGAAVVLPGTLHQAVHRLELVDAVAGAGLRVVSRLDDGVRGCCGARCRGRRRVGR